MGCSNPNPFQWDPNAERYTNSLFVSFPYDDGQRYEYLYRYGYKGTLHDFDYYYKNGYKEQIDKYLDLLEKYAENHFSPESFFDFKDKSSKVGIDFIIEELSYTYYKKGKKFFEDQQFKFAIDEFRTLSQIYPCSPYADNSALLMGYCYYRMQLYDWAKTSYWRVKQNYWDGDVTDNAIYSLAVLLYHVENNPVEAIKEYKLLVKSFPKSPYAPMSQYMIGVCYLDMGKENDALTELAKVETNYPKSDVVPQSKEKIKFILDKRIPGTT